MATQQRYPTADHSQVGTWNTAPFWSKVDDASDADFITGVATSGGDARVRFSFTAFSVPGGSTVSSVQVNFRATDDSLGTNTIGGMIRPSSTDRDAATINPTNSFAGYTATWTTNPDTGAAWTPAEVNTIALFGLWSNDVNPDIHVSSVELVVTYTESGGGGQKHLLAGKFVGKQQGKIG